MPLTLKNGLWCHDLCIVLLICYIYDYGGNLDCSSYPGGSENLSSLIFE